MIRPLSALALSSILLGGASYLPDTNAAVTSQTKTDKASTSEKPQRIEKDKSSYTPEQIVESTIYVYGSRPVLEQIRRKGLERGRITRFTPDGKIEEASYERRFIRGENPEKDKIRVDQKMPTMEYSLIFGEGRIWGLINGAAFIPREEATTTFLSQHRHSIDSLLRYKESGATVSFVGKEKLKGLDVFVVDLVDKDKISTRYYISVKSLHVLWLEYQDTPSAGGPPVKCTRKFFDYRYAQNTLLPYRIVLLEDGKQTQETRILTVTYGLKIDDTLFKNPEV